jgi:hypothetical protein
MSTFMPKYLMSIGDGNPADAIDWMDLDNLFFLSDLKWDAGKGSATIVNQAADNRWMQRRYDELIVMFGHAAKAAQPHAGNVRATIACQMGLDQTLYLDIVDGNLPGTPTVYPDQRTMTIPFTFTTLPYARGDIITDTASATLTNGAAYLYRDNIPGHVPALVRVELTDVSTSTVILNKARIGIWSDRYLYQASDFPAVIDAVAKSPGTSGAEAGTVGGTRIRVTTSADWQDVATFAVTKRGVFALVARVRDSATATAATMRITNVVNTFGIGSLPAGGYTYWVVALDASGTPKVLAISGSFVKHAASETGASHQSVVTWTAVTGAAGYRVYWKRDFQPTLYFNTGSTSTSYTHTTEASATAGSVPTTADASLSAALVRAVICSADGSEIRAFDPIQCQRSNSLWEYVTLYTGALPLHLRGESTLPDSCLVKVQARSSGTGTPTLDVDAGWLLARMDGSYAELTYRGGTLASKYTWVHDPDRTEVARSYLADGSGNQTGPLDGTPDALMAGPGPCLVNLNLEGAANDPNVVDLKVTLRLSFHTRFLSLWGLPVY